jgi:hypothetical protein
MSTPRISSREWSLLLAACSDISSEEKLHCIKDASQAPLAWNDLIALAERHGLQPMLYQGLRDLEESIPAEVMRSLSLGYQANLHKALLLSRELIRIVDCSIDLGIEAMPYKGLALAEMLYGDIAARQAGDLDLLIRPDDLSRLQNAVCDLGYRPHTHLSEKQQREYVKSGYELSFDGAAGPNLLELQWAFQPRFYAVDFNMSAVFERAVTVAVAGKSMKTPSPADLVLSLCVHAAKHVWERLIWICDLARLMRAPTLDWNWIGEEARELGISRILSVTMLLAQRFWHAPALTSLALPEDGLALSIADEIEQHIRSGAKFDTESPSYFRLMMRLRERPRDRWRFLTRLVFTPGPSEWQAVPLRQASSPVYRLVRLSRLAARLVKA